MLHIIKDLLQNTQLQQQIKEAASLAEAIKLITTANVQKNCPLTQESIAQVINGLMLKEQELSEEDLLAVAGGLRSTHATGTGRCCQTPF
jgi:hypothetical protein